MSEFSMSPQFSIKPLVFYDENSRRELLYVYPGDISRFAGCLFKKDQEGKWTLLRKATSDDIKQINKAVAGAHHK